MKDHGELLLLQICEWYISI